MQNGSLIKRLIHRVWDKTGGAIDVKDDSELVQTLEEDETEFVDKYEPAPLWVKVIYGTIFVAIVIAIAAWFLRGYNKQYEYIQTVILTLSLIVVAIYTNLTRKMQQAMVRQTNVGILPVFEVEILLEGRYDPYATGANVTQSRLELRNIGLGVALNVHMESIFVDCQGTYGAYNYLPVKFEKLYSLSPNQRKAVKDTQPYDVATARAVGIGRPDLLALIAKGRTYPKPELKIWFTDILGNKYVQVIHLGRHGITPDVVQLDRGQVVRTTFSYNGKAW